MWWSIEGPEEIMSIVPVIYCCAAKSLQLKTIILFYVYDSLDQEFGWGTVGGMACFCFSMSEASVYMIKRICVCQYLGAGIPKGSFTHISGAWARLTSRLV